MTRVCSAHVPQCTPVCIRYSRNRAVPTVQALVVQPVFDHGRIESVCGSASSPKLFVEIPVKTVMDIAPEWHRANLGMVELRVGKGMLLLLSIHDDAGDSL